VTASVIMASTLSFLEGMPEGYTTGEFKSTDFDKLRGFECKRPHYAARS